MTVRGFVVTPSPGDELGGKTEDGPKVPGSLHEALNMREGVEVLLPEGAGHEMSGTIMDTPSRCVVYMSLGAGRFARDGETYLLVSDRPSGSHGPYGGSYGFRLVPNLSA